MSDVIALKLSSSEEIIARVSDRDGATISVTKPMVVGIGPSPDNPRVPVIQMIPWVVSNQDGDIVINTNHVVAETVPHKEIVDGYIQQTTGIAIA